MASAFEPAMAFNVNQLSPRGRQIVDAARKVLEDEGPDALTMRRVAQTLGIQAPSIYKHLPDKETLESALISDGFEESAAFTAAAIQGAEDPLGALAAAYRTFALAHPHLYRLMTDRALNREFLAPGSEQRGAQPFIDAANDDRDLARALWAFAHGMTILELNHRFPPGAELAAAWQRGIDAFRPATVIAKSRHIPR